MRVDTIPHLGHSSSAPGTAVAGGGGTGGHNSNNRVGGNLKHNNQGGSSRGGGSPPIGTKGGRVGASRGGGVASRGGAGGIGPASKSEPSLLARQHQQQSGQQRQATGGGGVGSGREAVDGQHRSWTAGSGGNAHALPTGYAGRGGSPQGRMSFNPALSAGSDPGGALPGEIGGSRGGSGGGGQRQPWSEQAGKAVVGRHAPQLLYA